MCKSVWKWRRGKTHVCQLVRVEWQTEFAHHAAYAHNRSHMLPALPAVLPNLDSQIVLLLFWGDI